VLAACQARPAPSPPVVVPLAPDAAVPDAAVPDAAFAPVASVTLHARQIVKSPWGVRKTFTLTRTGVHAVFVIETATWADDKRVHLDGSELDESMWVHPLREEYAGAIHEIGGGKIQLELAIVSRSKSDYRTSTPHRDQLSFTCGDAALVVRTEGAIPIRIAPKSTIKTGCSGSPVRWQPPAVEELTLFACGPQSTFPRLPDLPFTADGSVDWVAELVDCHIQEVAYRRARPR
jgi:hypothetical protein